MADETGAEHGAGEETKSLTDVQAEGFNDDTESVRSLVEQSYREQDEDYVPPEDDAASQQEPVRAEGAPSEPEPEQDDENAPGDIEAPVHWKLADREMFARLPQAAQNFIMERSRGMEAAHTQRSQQIAQQAQALLPMQQTLQKWAPYFQQLGAAAPVAIDKVLHTEHELRTGSNAQKIEILRNLVRDYGIAAPDANEPPPDPRMQALQNQIYQMQNGYQQQQYQQMQQQQIVQQQRVAHTAQTLQQFATMKDEDGNIAHPFFGEVEQDMTRLAQADLAAGIQPELYSLYERAVWANPATRQRMTEAEANRREAEQKAEAERLDAEKREKARKARRAGSSISGAGAPAGEQPEDIRAILEAEYNRQVAA